MKAVDLSIVIAKEAGLRENVAKGYLRKSFIYNKMGDYKNAYEYYRIFNRHSDSIYNMENVKKIQKLELNHQFRQEKREVALLAESESFKKRLYLLLFILAIAAAGIIGFLVRRVYRSRTQVALERLEKQKIQKQLLDQKIEAKEEEIKRLIADNTMRLTFKEELLGQLKQEMSNKKPEELKQSLTTLAKDLKSQISTEGKLSGLQHKINEVNQGFDTLL